MEVNEKWKEGVQQAWDENAPNWSAHSKNMWETGSRKTILPFCEKHFKELGEVLDIGCGNGYSTSLLQEKMFRPVGIDVSNEMIRFARKSYPELSFHQGDIQQLPYEKASFDGVLMINVIEWTPSPKEVLYELNRIMKRDGMMCAGILGPTAGPRKVSFNRLLGETAIMNTMMPWEFITLAEQNGFKAVDQQIVPKNWDNNIRGELPLLAQQALSFMTVVMLKKENDTEWT